MFRVSDFMPPDLRAFAPLAAGAPTAAGAAPSWFDGEIGAAVRIGADLAAEGRGLSVAQHAERVLAQLCAPADRA